MSLHFLKSTLGAQKILPKNNKAGQSLLLLSSLAASFTHLPRYSLTRVSISKRAYLKDDLGASISKFYFEACVPAMRPKTIASATPLPPTRLDPWTPPVTSPAAKSPLIGLPFLLRT